MFCLDKRHQDSTCCFDSKLDFMSIITLYNRLKHLTEDITRACKRWEGGGLQKTDSWIKLNLIDRALEQCVCVPTLFCSVFSGKVISTVPKGSCSCSAATLNLILQIPPHLSARLLSRQLRRKTESNN